MLTRRTIITGCIGAMVGCTLGLSFCNSNSRYPGLIGVPVALAALGAFIALWVDSLAKGRIKHVLFAAGNSSAIIMGWLVILNFILDTFYALTDLSFSAIDGTSSVVDFPSSGPLVLVLPFTLIWSAKNARGADDEGPVQNSGARPIPPSPTV